EDQKAYELAMKARVALPEDTELARALGILSFRRGDYRATIRFLNQSADGGSANGSTLYYLGMAYYQLKDIRQSRNVLQRAVALNLPHPFADEAKRVLAEL